MSAESQSQIDRTLDAVGGRGFTFGQGAVIQAFVPGQMSHQPEQASGENFATGRYYDGVSRTVIDLGVLHRATTPSVDGSEIPVVEGPHIDVWFAPARVAVDISAILDGSDLDDGAIPMEMAQGPITSQRSGPAAAGFSALLTRMCSGRLILDPAAFLDLIGAVDPDDLVAVDDDAYAPLRVFNATIPMDRWLHNFGLDTMSIVSQLASLGLGAVGPIGEHFLTYLQAHLPTATVGLAWFIDEQDRVHTCQVVINLTELLAGMLRSFDPSNLSDEDNDVDEAEWLAHIDSSLANGQLGFVNATWQIFEFDADDVESEGQQIAWPDGEDLSARIAAQVAQEADS